MLPSPDCPQLALLKQFLNAESLPETALPWTRELLEQHLEECQSCQESLERLVAGQESWEGAANLLAGIEADNNHSSVETEALRQLMETEKERIPDVPRETTSPMDGPSLDTMRLDFLQPSDQPDSRGRLGQYEILDIVGRGGMGVVLKAYDPSLRRIVAIKVMASHLASSPVARKRFVREARAAAAVSHDHVVAIYAVEENQDPPFLVMQFIRGKTLHERLVAEGSLSVNEVLRIGMQVAAGLAAAHSQGLVHRDIKPANILLENGVERVKITDFGLARAVNDAGMTQTGIVAGTPQFMAPEQANGEQIDLRSDLFSLGSVLYMLCTGRPPFRATTVMGLLKRICEEYPKPLRELNPEIPDWLDAIVMKLLAKRPADRYQSAKEVADLLEQWLAHTQRPLSIPRPNTPLAASSSSERFDKAELLTTATGQVPSDQFPPIAGKTEKAVRPSSPGFWADYSRTAPFTGNPEKVFDLATATLTAEGFEPTETSGSHLSFAGPGLTRVTRNTLATASLIQLTQGSGHLTLVADLGAMRKFHRNLLLIPFICASLSIVICVLNIHNFQVIPGNILIATLPVLFSATVAGLLIVRGRKVARQTWDTFFENLINSEQSPQPREIVSQTPGHRWVEQFQNSWRETFCNRIYGTTALIWAAWEVFLLDSSRNFISFMHWIAIVTLGLGVAWPAGILTFAWLQKLRRGTWEGTVLPRGPRHFLLRPFMFLFLFGAAYWGWQQMTCGTIAFDIDDREFTVSLTGPSLDSSQNFSADFHPLRVRAGTYNWGIRHSRDLIATGQIEVDPLQEYTIRFRSPYPIGQADIQCLPGRWELTVSYNGSSAFMTKTAIPTEIESSTKTVEFMDVTENELRVHSGRLSQLLNAAVGQADQRSANVGLITVYRTVYRFRATRPSAGLRGPSWIDLIRQNPQTQEDDVVAHGIFTADRKHLSFQLGPVDAPRPTWSTPYDNSVLMLQFERASDRTLLQGEWSDDSDTSLFPIHMTFAGSHFEARNLVPSSGTIDAGTFSLDTIHDPKQITFSTSPLEGLVRITAGVFRFVDDDHIKLHISTDEKAPAGFEPAPGSKSRVLNLVKDRFRH